MAQKPKAIITQQRLEFSGSSASHQSASIHEDSGKMVFGNAGSNYWEINTDGTLVALGPFADMKGIDMNNHMIYDVHTIRINDIGLYEGLEFWNGGVRKSWIGHRSTLNTDDYNAITFGSSNGDNFEFIGANVGIRTNRDTDNSGSVPATLTIGGDVIFGTAGTSGSLGTDVFQSGFAGKGFRIATGSDGKWGLTTDNLTVRGSMSVYELLLQQVRANNGSIWISSTGKVDSIEYKGSGNDYKLNFDSNDGAGHGFGVNDLIRAQRWNNASETTLLSNLQVTAIDGTGSLSASLVEGSAPASGYEYVRIGNTSNADRDGAIYLTSDDGNAPYIDVIDGVTSHNAYSGSSQVKARFGNLSGITDGTFGNLSGYGLYSERAYLTGGIKATVGEIGGWKIGSSKISSSNVTIDSSTEGGKITVGSYVSLSGTGTSTISGWEIGNVKLSKNNIELNSATDNGRIMIGNGVGKTSGAGFYVDGNRNFWVGDYDGNRIAYTDSAGLSITSSNVNITAGNTSISTTNFELDATNLELSSTNASMSLGEGKIVLQGGSSYTNIKIGDSNAIKMESDGTDHYLVFGGKNSFAEFDQSTAGLILGTDNGTSKFEVVGDANNLLSFNGTSFNLKSTNAVISGSNVTLGAETFNLTSTNLHITDETAAAVASKIVLSGGDTKVHVGSGITMDGAVGTGAGQIDVNSRVILNGTGESQIADWYINDDHIRTSIGSEAMSNIYLSSNADDSGLNIQDGLQIYRHNNDVAAGKVKAIRVGGLSTTSLTAANDYGIQVLRRNSAGDGFENILYIGESTQTISGWNISTNKLWSTNISLDNANEHIVLGDHIYADAKIAFSGSGEGKLAGGNITWDASGNTIITGSVTIGADVSVSGQLEVGALPRLPDESSLLGYWSLDDLEPFEDNLLDVSESQFFGNETGSWSSQQRNPSGTFGSESYVKALYGKLRVAHQTGYDNSQTWTTYSFTTQVDEVYRITAKVKWNGGSTQRAGFDIHNGKEWQSVWHSGDGQWEDLELIFLSKTTGTKALRAALYNETGIAYFDDIKIEKYRVADSSTIYLDNSGNGYSGSVIGGSPKSSTDSISGKSLFFLSESSDRVQLHTPKNFFKTGDPFSFSVWAKRYHPTTGSADPIDIYDGTENEGNYSTNGHGLMMRGSTDDSTGLFYRHYVSNAIYANFRTDNQATEISYQMPDDGLNWHHYVMTYTPNTATTGLKLYVDGELKATGHTHTITEDMSGSDDYVMLGGNKIGGGNSSYFNGFLDEPRIYNKAITADEVKSIYLNPTAQGSTVISGDQISTGKIKSNNLTTTKGSELDLDGGTIKLGGTSTPKFAVDTDGAVTSSAGTIGGFNINESSISSSNDNLKLFDTGIISGSDVHFSGGKIADWTITSNSITSPSNKVYISSNNNTIYAYPNGAGDTTKFVHLGQTYDGSSYTGNYGISAVDGNNNFIFRLDDSARSIAGWNFNSDKFFTGTDEGVSGYTTDSLILSSSGAIHSKQFYINKDGDASFKGSIAIGSQPRLPADDDLIAYYNFDGVASGSTFLLDNTGRTGNANLHGNASPGGTGLGATSSYAVPPVSIIPSGSSGQGLYFNGTIFARVPGAIGKAFNSGSIGNPGGNWGVSFWFKPPKTDGGGTIRMFFNAQAGSSTNVYMLRYDADGNPPSVQISVSSGNDSSWVNLVRDKWQHIVATFDGYSGDTPGQVHLYVDGELKASKPQGISEGSAPTGVDRLIFGCDLDGNSNANQAIIGGVDELRVYSKTLTDKEIEGLYQNPSGNQGTLISGDQITTGKIKSNNWNDDNIGSLINLDDGVVELGGKGPKAKVRIDESGNLALSGSVSASAGEIGGWVINETNLNNISSAGGISIDAGNKIITARTGSTSDTVRVRFGEINSGQFGIQGEDVGRNIIFNLGEQGNTIGGWSFASQSLASGGILLYSDSTNPFISVGTGNFGAEGVWMGKDVTDSSKVKFSVGDGSNNYLKVDTSSPSGVDIKTTNFKVDTSTFDVDTANGGEISLGSNKEILLSGSGEGHLAGGKINFDKDGNLIISGASLTLDDSGTSLIPDYYDVANSKYVVMRDKTQYYGTFKDNTTITVLDTDRNVTQTIAVDNANSLGQISAGDIDVGYIIEADKPISLYSMDTNGVPLNILSKNYGTYVTRYMPSAWRVYSPFVSASVTMSWGTTTGAYTSASLSASFAPDTAGYILSPDSEPDDADNRFYSITSSVPVSMLSAGWSGGNLDGDVSNLFPMVKELLWPDSTITNADSGLIKSFDGQSITRVNGIGIAGSVDSGSSLHNTNGTAFYSSDYPFQVQLTGDGHGGDAHQGIPLDHLGDTYMITHPVGGYQVVSVEPCIVRAWKLDGVGGKTLIGTHDLSASTKSQPRYFCTGSHAHDWENTTICNIADTGMYLEGTAPFALRTNGPTDNGEYVVLGYRRDANPQYNSNVNYPWQPSDTTTISGDRIRTGKIESNNYSYSSGDFSTAGTKINLNDGTVVSRGFSLSSTKASFSGSILAKDGNIGGWGISDTEITASSNQVKLVAGGNPYISVGGAAWEDTGIQLQWNSGTPRAHIGSSTEYFQFEDGKVSIETAPLKITSGGNLIISGTVTAGAGTIGGWTVGSTLSATNILLDPSTPKITLGSKTGLDDANTGLYLGTDGLAAGANGVFKAHADGTVTATSATITGNITADTLTANSAGTIAGWSIDSDSISTGSGGYNNNMNMRISNTSSAGAFYNWAGQLEGISLTWHKINHAGHLVFGQLAGTNASIKNDYYGLQMMDYLGNEFFALSTDIHASTSTGAHTYNRIAGWSFNATQLSSGDVAIDSGNEIIKLGSAGHFLNIGDGLNSDSGILMGKESSGNYDFFVGKKDGNHIWWDASSAELKVSGNITVTGGNVDTQLSNLNAVSESNDVTQLPGPFKMNSRMKANPDKSVGWATNGNTGPYGGRKGPWNDTATKLSAINIVDDNSSDTGGLSGSVLEIDGDGTNGEWVFSQYAIPVENLNHVYELEFKVRSKVLDSQGKNGVYAGFACLDEDFNQTNGSQGGEGSGAGTHRYFAASGQVLSDTDWHTYTGQITGVGTGASDFRSDTKYVRPMFIVNYNGGTGTAQVAHVKLKNLTTGETSEQNSVTDDSGMINFNPTPSGNGLFLGADNLGFYDNSDWKTYMSSSGDFFLKGTNGSLTWDRSADTLSIKGEINATSGWIGTENVGWDINTDRMRAIWGAGNDAQIAMKSTAALAGVGNNGWNARGFSLYLNDSQLATGDVKAIRLGQLGARPETGDSPLSYLSDDYGFEIITKGSERLVYFSSASAQIGGWEIHENHIEGLLGDSNEAGIRMGQKSGDADQYEIRISSDNLGTGTTNYVRMYTTTGSVSDTWGIEGVSGGDRLFHLGETNSANDNVIAGWNFNTSSLYKNNKIYFSSTSSNGQIWLGSSGYSTAGIGFEGDGSGKLAGGKIYWDSSGNLTISGSTFEVNDFPKVPSSDECWLNMDFSGVSGSAVGTMPVNYSQAGQITSTVSGNPTFTDGVVGTGIHFDGNDTIVFGDDIKPTTAITLAAWCKFEDDGNFRSIFGKDTLASWWLRREQNNKLALKLVYDDATNSGEMEYGSFKVEDGWVHLAVTWDNSDGKVRHYKNGVLLNTDTSGVGKSLRTNGIVRIGQASGQMLGSIDEPRIWGRRLSTNEIQSLYLNPQGEKGTTISGDQISTGGITSNNYGSTQGTKIDLDNEKIIIGGSNNESGLSDGIILDASTVGQPKFLVGDSTSFIKYNDDGSSKNLEISTTNFSINSAGSVSMTGTVNASGGTFSGYITAGNAQIGTGLGGNANNDGLYLDANNYIMNVSDIGTFKLGDGSSYITGLGSSIGIHMDGSDSFSINSSTFNVETSGDGGNGVITLGSNSEIQLSGSGGGHLAAGKIKWTNSGDLTISGSTIEINDFPILPDDTRLMYYADFSGDEIIDVTGRNTGSMTYDNVPTFTQGTGSIVGRALQQTANHDIRLPYQQETVDVLQSQNFTWTMWVTVNGESNWRDFVTFPILYQTASETPTSTTWRFEHSRDNNGSIGDYSGGSAQGKWGIWFGTYKDTGNFPAITTPHNENGLDVGRTYFIALDSNKTEGYMKAYVDGELIDTETDNFGTITSIPTHEFRILDGTNTGDTLDEFRVYSGSLSANEIRALYLNPAGNKGTKISGDNVTTGKLISNNYNPPDDEEIFSDAGTEINLNDGTITSTGFRIEEDGDTYFGGNLTAGATNTTFDSTKGLKAYWKFDRVHWRNMGGQNWEYAHDQSGNGLDLWFTSGVTFSYNTYARDGKSQANLQNGDYSFVRGNDVHTVIGTQASSSQVFNQQYGEHTSSMAVSVWFRPSANADGQRRVIVSHRHNGGWAIEYDTSGVEFSVHDGDDFETAEADVSLVDDTWYHIVGVFNGADKAVYCYVQEEGHTGTYPQYQDTELTNNQRIFFDGNYNLVIGDEPSTGEWNSTKQLGSGDAHALGYIDEVRIYSVALTRGEAEALYLGKEVTGNLGTISGERVVAGQLESMNLSADAGSEFNLRDGKFKLGGTENPKLHWDGSTLKVDGEVSVGSLAKFPSLDKITWHHNFIKPPSAAWGDVVAESEIASGSFSWMPHFFNVSGGHNYSWQNNGPTGNCVSSTTNAGKRLDAYLSTGKAGTIPTSELSLAGWFRFNHLATIEGFGPSLCGSAYSGYMQKRVDNRLLLQLKHDDGNSSAIIVPAGVADITSTTDWYHIGVSWKASTGETRFFVNGVMVYVADATVNSTKDLATDLTKIIHPYSGGNREHDGEFTQTLVAHKALTDDEMAWLYTNPVAWVGETLAQGTTISGDMISTGNIKSNNWDGDIQGTKIDLNGGEIRAKGNDGEGWFLNSAKGMFDFSVGGMPATDAGVTWDDTGVDMPMGGSGTSGGNSYITPDQEQPA